MVRRLVVLTVLLVATGCLWRGYAKILAVHLDVLTQTAAKLEALVEARRGPTAQSMAEFVYPAQRAREFLRQFGTYHERASYQRFSTFLDRYEAMVHEADAVRAGGGDWQAELTRLSAGNAALEDLATQIRAALHDEG